MTLEAAAIILALLWGPTALWLLFRAVRGPTSGTREAFAREPARPRIEQGPLEAVLRNEYWICLGCRSVNHLGATQCYSCGVQRPAPERVAPDPVVTGTGWVAVMDPDIRRRNPEPAGVTPLQSTSSAIPRNPQAAVPMLDLAPEPAMVDGGPGTAASRATKRPRAPRRPRTSAAGATAAELSVAAHMTAAPPAAIAPAGIASAATAPELGAEPAVVDAGGGAAASRPTKRSRTPRRPNTPAGDTAAAELSADAHVTAAPPAAVAPRATAAPPLVAAPQLPQVTPSIAPSVCPYLGFKADPTTRCSFPDDRNVCHAAAANGGSSVPTPRGIVRSVRGHGRTLPISAEHQANVCLTTEHPKCDRFPAALLRADPNQTH